MRDLAAAFEDLGERVDEAAPVAAERALRASLEATAGAGRDPQGKPWAGRVDGGRPLVGVVAQIRIERDGDRVYARIGSPAAFHHYGAGGSSTSPAAERARKRAARRRAEAGTASKFHAPARRILPVGMTKILAQLLREKWQAEIAR